MKPQLLALVFVAGTLAVAQKSQTNELAPFKTFIQEHPRALDELKKVPSLIGRLEFVAEHKVVGEYLAQHPQVIPQVKAVPHFFDDLKATTKGGEHRPHPDENRGKND